MVSDGKLHTHTHTHLMKTIVILLIAFAFNFNSALLGQSPPSLPRIEQPAASAANTAGINVPQVLDRIFNRDKGITSDNKAAIRAAIALYQGQPIQGDVEGFGLNLAELSVLASKRHDQLAADPAANSGYWASVKKYAVEDALATKLASEKILAWSRDRQGASASVPAATPVATMATAPTPATTPTRRRIVVTGSATVRP